MVIKTLAMFNWLGLRPNFFTSELVEVQIPPGYFDFFQISSNFKGNFWVSAKNRKLNILFILI